MRTRAHTRAHRHTHRDAPTATPQPHLHLRDRSSPAHTPCSQQRALRSDTAVSAFSHVGRLAGEFLQPRWHFYGSARAVIYSVRKDRAILLPLCQAPSRRLLGMGRPGGPSTSPMPRGSADVQRLNSLPPMSPSGGFPCWSALAHRVPLSFLGSFSCLADL